MILNIYIHNVYYYRKKAYVIELSYTVRNLKMKECTTY